MTSSNGKLTACLIPVGGQPQRIEIDPENSLSELQGHVGGNIDVLAVRGDGIELVVNDEGLFSQHPNRAIFADAQMGEAGYLSQLDYRTPVKEGDFYSVTFGNVVALRSDPETGGWESLTEADLAKLQRDFRDPETGWTAAVAIKIGMDPTEAFTPEQRGLAPEQGGIEEMAASAAAAEAVAETAPDGERPEAMAEMVACMDGATFGMAVFGAAAPEEAADELEDELDEDSAADGIAAMAAVAKAALKADRAGDPCVEEMAPGAVEAPAEAGREPTIADMAASAADAVAAMEGCGSGAQARSAAIAELKQQVIDFAVERSNGALGEDAGYEQALACLDEAGWGYPADIAGTIQEIEELEAARGDEPGIE